MESMRADYMVPLNNRSSRDHVESCSCSRGVTGVDEPRSGIQSSKSLCSQALVNAELVRDESSDQMARVVSQENEPGP